MEHHFNIMGIYTVGDLANYNVNELKRRFGVIGEELYYHANGIDSSLVQDKYKLRSKSKSFGNSQVLFEDYYVPEIYTIILEMIDELTRRLRLAKKEGKTSVSYTHLPFETMLVVADKSRGDGSICLATTPYLKLLGAKSRGRIFELPEHLKDKIIYARPRMKTYLEYTMKLIEIYLSFIACLLYTSRCV